MYIEKNRARAKATNSISLMSMKQGIIISNSETFLKTDANKTLDKTLIGIQRDKSYY